MLGVQIAEVKIGCGFGLLKGFIGQTRAQCRIGGNPAYLVDVEFAPPMIAALHVGIDQNTAVRKGRNTRGAQKRRIQNRHIVGVGLFGRQRTQNVCVAALCVLRHPHVFDEPGI